jgi:hypothetical protein
MRLIHGVLVLVGELALSAAPLLANKSPAIQRELVSSSSFTIEAQGKTGGAVPVAGSTPAAPEQGAHMDHKSKHGGTFFMALDNKHHLEGILVPPGTFRVYLYDDHTKPLKAEETRKASGTVQVGESDEAPKIDLAPGKKKETLEANLGNGVKFPVTLTMLLHLPGMELDAKPELFDFKFTQFTDEHGPGSCRPMSSMPNMRC